MHMRWLSVVMVLPDASRTFISQVSSVWLNGQLSLPFPPSRLKLGADKKWNVEVVSAFNFDLATKIYELLTKKAAAAGQHFSQWFKKCTQVVIGFLTIN